MDRLICLIVNKVEQLSVVAKPVYIIRVQTKTEQIIAPSCMFERKKMRIKNKTDLARK